MIYDNEDQDNDTLIYLNCYDLTKRYFKGFGT